MSSNFIFNFADFCDAASFTNIRYFISASVRIVTVAKLIIRGISFLASFMLALRLALAAKLVISVILSLIFFYRGIIHTFFDKIISYYIA